VLTFKYERYQEHCDSHRNMTHQKEKLQTPIVSGQAVSIPAITHCLKKWLVGHILQEDMKLPQLIDEIKLNSVHRLRTGTDIHRLSY